MEQSEKPIKEWVIDRLFEEWLAQAMPKATLREAFGAGIECWQWMMKELEKPEC